MMLAFKPQSIHLMIQDNGKGFAITKTRKGFGLVIMQERTNHIGGKLLIRSDPGKGSRVVISISA